MHYSEQDVEFAAAVAPLLAPRVRADLRVPGPRVLTPPRAGDNHLGPGPVDARRHRAGLALDRSPGHPGPNPAEPLPPQVGCVLSAHVAASPQRRSARVRARVADGTWMVIRAAALTSGSQAQPATPSLWRPPQPMTSLRCSCGPATHPPRAGGGPAGHRWTVHRGHRCGAVHLRPHRPRPPQDNVRQGRHQPPPGPGRYPHRKNAQPSASNDFCHLRHRPQSDAGTTVAQPGEGSPSSRS